MAQLQSLRRSTHPCNAAQLRCHVRCGKALVKSDGAGAARRNGGHQLLAAHHLSAWPTSCIAETAARYTCLSDRRGAEAQAA